MLGTLGAAVGPVGVVVGWKFDGDNVVLLVGGEVRRTGNFVGIGVGTDVRFTDGCDVG